MPALEPYAPRQYASLPIWTVGSLRLKPYVIQLPDGAGLPDRTMEAARGVTSLTLRQAAAAESGSHDLGFVILHAGLAGTWLLMDWWAHKDICCQRLARADPGSADFVDVSDRPLMACVWELRVIAHERDAWIEHMLTPAPDPEGYLADRLAADLC